ncbi:hypothetical protein E2C01_101662 [Portunus trituberculatus]|uniref:Uncharacterized protein n=1 Tax=Portunus trituberculatus TaxID=210409 RepID=A0A5B7KA65_PORTR|nr:hypothetical protein [Portunus trituberculatus]
MTSFYPQSPRYRAQKPRETQTKDGANEGMNNGTTLLLTLTATEVVLCWETEVKLTACWYTAYCKRKRQPLFYAGGSSA